MPTFINTGSFSVIVNPRHAAIAVAHIRQIPMAAPNSWLKSSRYHRPTPTQSTAQQQTQQSIPTTPLPPPNTAYNRT